MDHCARRTCGIAALVAWGAVAALAQAVPVPATASATQPASAATSAPAGEQTAARARTLLDAFLRGEIDAFLAAGNPQVQAVFKPAAAKLARDRVIAMAGAPQRQLRHEEARQGDGPASLLVNTITIAHERADVTYELTLDAAGRMAGFFLRNVDSAKAWRAPAYVDPARFRAEKVTVGDGEFALPGVLTLPNVERKCAAVVLVHGSGPHDEDEAIGPNRPFRDLGEGLASRGVAVLRYVKRTKAHGARMNPEKITLEDETINDAVAAVALLRARPEVDPAAVYVLGHSLGGFAAPYIAEREPALAGIIIMAGTARPILDLIPEQFAYIAGLDGSVSADEQKQLDDVRRAVAAIRAGRPGEVTEPLLGAPAVYWKNLDAYDPLTPLAGFAGRVLVIHGGRDYQVTRACLERWREGLLDRPTAVIREFPRLNHLMIAGEGPSTPGEYARPGNVDEELIQTIAGWISR